MVSSSSFNSIIKKVWREREKEGGRELHIFESWLYLLTASSEAKRTSPGTMARKAFPVWDLTKGAITEPVARPTPSSIALLIFSVILDSFLTL